MLSWYMGLLKWEDGKFDLYLVAKRAQENLWFDDRDQINCMLKIVGSKLSATKNVGTK